METNNDISWAYPFQFDKTGRVRRVGGKSTVAPTSRQLLESCVASLKQVLFTSPGERVMIPEFGVDSDQYVFTPLHGTSLGFLPKEIREQVSSWSMRCEVGAIKLQPVIGAEGTQVNVSLTLIHPDSGLTGTATAVFG